MRSVARFILNGAHKYILNSLQSPERIVCSYFCAFAKMCVQLFVYAILGPAKATYFVGCGAEVGDADMTNNSRNHSESEQKVDLRPS